MLLQKLLESQELLGDALDHVEAVDAQHDLAAGVAIVVACGVDIVALMMIDHHDGCVMVDV